MGFLKETSEELWAKANSAYEEGRQRFTVRLSSVSGRKDDEIESWSRQIEAIEQVGWVTDHFSVRDGGGRAEAYVLFKRQS
jgi:hypothetical protein